MADLLTVQIRARVTMVAGKTEAQIIQAAKDTLPTTALASAAVTMGTITSIQDVEVFEDVGPG
jgi:hypothetical protein